MGILATKYGVLVGISTWEEGCWEGYGRVLSRGNLRNLRDLRRPAFFCRI